VLKKEYVDLLIIQKVNRSSHIIGNNGRWSQSIDDGIKFGAIKSSEKAEFRGSRYNRN